MAAFKAAVVVEALDWDFAPYVHASGCIKEPTDDQIAQFLNDLKAMFTKLKQELPEGTDTDNLAEVAGAIDEMDATTVVEAHKEMAPIFAALCSNEPSAELLLSVPMRVRTIFYGWIRQEVMSPEAAPGAGSAQVTTLRSAAAG